MRKVDCPRAGVSWHLFWSLPWPWRAVVLSWHYSTLAPVAWAAAAGFAAKGKHLFYGNLTLVSPVLGAWSPSMLQLPPPTNWREPLSPRGFLGRFLEFMFPSCFLRLSTVGLEMGVFPTFTYCIFLSARPFRVAFYKILVSERNKRGSLVSEKLYYPGRAHLRKTAY